MKGIIITQYTQLCLKKCCFIPPIRTLKDIGIVWEAYQRAVPLLGIAENPTVSNVFFGFSKVGGIKENCNGILEFLLQVPLFPLHI